MEYAGVTHGTIVRPPFPILPIDYQSHTIAMNRTATLRNTQTETLVMAFFPNLTQPARQHPDLILHSVLGVFWARIRSLSYDSYTHPPPKSYMQHLFHRELSYHTVTRPESSDPESLHTPPRVICSFCVYRGAPVLEANA
jgi:hypothetical protein